MTLQTGQAMFRHLTVYLILIAGYSTFAHSKAKVDSKSTTLPAKNEEEDSYHNWYKKLAKRDFKFILENYSFPNDFSSKPEERDAYPEVFWKYPLQLPKVEFKIESDFGDPAAYIPIITGSDRIVEHINKGRVAFLKGNYDEARRIWLTARNEFKDNNPHSKRLNYLIGMVYLKIAQNSSLSKVEDPTGVQSKINEGYYGNTNTFLSHAFTKEKTTIDPEIDPFAPRALYNVAAIYHKFSRFPAAYHAATEALTFLKETGKKEFRFDLHRIISESLIINGNYIDAVRELDQAIRQDPDPAMARHAFSRIGDIYFGLNNYEFSENAYTLAIGLDKEFKTLSSHQGILRGEALFWSGYIDEAQEMLLYGIEGAKHSKSPVEPTTLGWAKLRYADTWMAKASLSTGNIRKEHLSKARLEYFRVMSEYQGSEQAITASLRFYCLELPAYDGNNVLHARQFLETLKTEHMLPPQGVELAWACYTNSFTSRERTEAMLAKVSEFASRYPRSKFLNSMTEPVKEVKSSYLGELLELPNKKKAIEFYEKYGKTLYKNGLKDEWATQLFAIYYDRLEIEKAKPFWPVIQRQKIASNTDLIRRISWLEEQTNVSKDTKMRKLLGEYLTAATNLKWSESDSASVKKYLPRIRSVDDDFSSGPWIVDWLASGNLNLEQLCKEVMPLISSASQKEKKAKLLENWLKLITKEIDKSLGDLISKDAGCTASLVDLEAFLFKRTNKESQFASLWLNRRTQSVSLETVGYIWAASEIFEKEGKSKEANVLWNLLTDPKNSKFEESKWAKLKLDPSKTEYEDLWKK